MIPCEGGPLDGAEVANRGAIFQPISGTGHYVLEQGVYRWHPR